MNLECDVTMEGEDISLFVIYIYIYIYIYENSVVKTLY